MNRWWFIPRDKGESIAENAINSMLAIEFEDVYPICLLSGVLYEHIASNGSRKGDAVTSFNTRSWSQLDPSNEFVVLPRRPRIDGVQKTFHFIIRGNPRVGDDKPVPLFPSNLPSYYSPLPRSKRVGRQTFSNCKKISATLEEFRNEEINNSSNQDRLKLPQPLSPIPEDSAVEYVLEGNEEDDE